MLTKSNQRVQFSPECELLIYTPSVTCLDSDSDHTIEATEDAAKDGGDADDSSLQALASPSPTLTKHHSYLLGDKIRSSADMEKFTALEDTIEAIYNLKLSEFAWVKRKSGDWTFSQLVKRTMNDRGEEIMVFLVSEMGHRKTMRPSRWIKMVRKCSSHVRSEYFQSLIVPIQKQIGAKVA